MTDRKIQALQNLADRPGTPHEGELAKALVLVNVPRDAEGRDRRVMAALKTRGVPLTVQAYTDEWHLQFGNDLVEFREEPKVEPAPAPVPIGPAKLPPPIIPPTTFATTSTPTFASTSSPAFVMVSRDGSNWTEHITDSDIRKDLDLAKKQLEGFWDFWERAARAVGLEHPPRWVDPIPPERAYQRQTLPFDDGWRGFTADDILIFLQTLRRRP